MFNTPLIQKTIEEVENNLKKLGFNDKEINYWLVRFELAIREAMGEKILSAMPMEKRLETERMVGEGKSPADFMELIKAYSNKDELQAIYQKKLDEINKELSSWTNEVLPVFAEIKERIEREILPQINPV